jgi:hypothetical protein
VWLGIRFLKAEKVRRKFHRHVVTVFGEGGMKEGTVREWFRLFKKGRSNVHDEERGGRLSLATDESKTKISGK